MTVDSECLSADRRGYIRDLRQIVILREQRGWTQEKLAEQSGVSVRTIRNMELGLVDNPRRSTVELLAQALGLPGEQEDFRLGGLDLARWRGPQPSGSARVGGSADHEEIVRSVRAHRLATLLGPGGVGKTRSALSVAAEVGPAFRHGVVVVELGHIKSERNTQESQEAVVMDQVRQHLNALDTGRETNVLLVLDNAEHVPKGVTAVTRTLLGTFPGVHVLVTARRRLTERLGVNHEILPLPVEAVSGDGHSHSPAVELVLRHAGTDAKADLAKDLPLVTELCRRLGGVPRYLEFAAERMRTIPVRLLLEHGPSVEMLWSNDHMLLPHQRSVVDSAMWNLDLLDDDHRRLLTRIAALPASRFTLDDLVTSHNGSWASTVASASDDRYASSANSLTLLSGLQELSLVLADPDDRYCYRLAPYVAEVADLLRLGGAEAEARPPTVGN